MQKHGFSLERGSPPPEQGGDGGKSFDEDGRTRTGTWVTASAHIITAVIGSGVLSLAWAVAQLGWVVGPAVLAAFSLITFFTSTMLTDCYRAPGPAAGRRNYTYMEVVRAHLGGVNVRLCGIAQYTNLVGISIGYTITASISMVAVRRSNCFHRRGHGAACAVSNYPLMIVFGGIQAVLSQIPNFHELSFLSILAAVMSFAYSLIGLGLSAARVAGSGGRPGRTSLTGTTIGVDVTASEKVWRSFQAIGDIAFAYAYSTVLIEIQDTLKPNPPENRTMKRATAVGIATTTTFYVLCGLFGYAAFGNAAPGNFLTGFGFYEPFWLVDLANVCIAVHLIGAYQVFCQPVYAFVENLCSRHWPESKFISHEYPINVPFCGACPLNLFRLVWRTVYVIITVLIAMLLPFFNDFLGLLGAASFWPLTVYFPIEMHIAQRKLPRYSTAWVGLKMLSGGCLAVSMIAAAGSIEGLAQALKKYKPFQSEQ